MNSKKKLEEELYEILDLLNPSDRELEAKILLFIKKYENIGTESSIKISKFFEDVYNHFFDTDNYEESFQEQYEEQYEEQENSTEGFENIKTSYSDEANKKYISNDYKAPNGNIITSGNTIIPSQQVANEKRNENVVFTTNLEYTKDPLNPLLKQTTTRVISIDSQYRDNKASLTTDFAFELSEPLRDVVSMKLYSFQIPYTWYTIGKSYGCNFFYLKGSTDGVNNGNHDISFSINPGNYTPNELATSVQASIVNARQIYTDVSFGKTNINYNSNTSLSTLSIDIKNQFNENGYYMNFPYFTSPYRNDKSRSDSIPAFLGFETRNYYTNSLKSTFSFPLINNSNNNDDINKFFINSNNNYFKVIKYVGPDEYNTDSIIDISFNIYINTKDSIGNYSRNRLLNDLSNAIYNCIYLDNTYRIGSSIKRKNIDPSNGIPYNTNPVNNPNGSYFELKIKPSRYTTTNTTNSKIAIQFPYEDPNSINNIWTGISSCFGFKEIFNEINNIYTEVPLIPEPQIFLIDNSVKIYLKSVHSGFDIAINDIVINIPPNISTIDNYSFVPYDNLVAYINAINTGIKNADSLYNGSLNTNATTGGTKAYIDDNGFFNLYLDIEKTFDESTYTMDLTNSILNKNHIRLKDASGNKILTDLTKTYSTFINRGGISVNSNTILAVIYPKNNTNNGNKGDVTYTLRFGQSTNYTDYTFFESDVNKIFNTYIDPITGRNIFTGTKLTHTTTKTGYQVTFTIKIAKKLVAKNYSVNFIDTNSTNASWRNYLFIDKSLFNTFYNLETAFSISNNPIFNDSNEQILSIDNSNEVTVIGINSIIYQYMNINRGINNIINFFAYEDGIKSEIGSNNLTIDILKNTNNDNLAVTVNDLINIINGQFDNSDYFKGSKITTYYVGNYQYLKIRMNVNRIYTAKDYNLVFYDEISFVRCFVGTTSVQNTTWDSTLGWILGFREYTIYYLSNFISNNDISLITGDTGVCTNLYNYFLLCLDDYNQNHLNDGLVTIANKETIIGLPSYANISNRTCNPVTGQLSYNTSVSTDNNKLNANQIYTLAENNNSKYNTTATGKTVSSKSYGNGPSAKDVIAILPMKVAGLQNGASYMEFGGTLQNQGRNYFGPVNIRKMAVSLLSDRGNRVDLNNANWSFSIIVESLNKLKPST